MKTLQELFNVIDDAHGDQEYGDNVPYSDHLRAVETAAAIFGWWDDPIIALACYGHDVLEDTKMTPEILLEEGFPEEVVEIVKAVTDEPGKNRKERKAKTYPKIKANRKALIVKLCDRIANCTNCYITQNTKLGMYRREQAEFEKILRDPEDKELEPMWNWINRILKETEVKL